MGRNKIYNTKNEQKSANSEYRKKSYEKHKDENKEKYRYSSLRSYYRRQLALNLGNPEINLKKIQEYTEKLQALKSK